jgi:hypothetical protein
MPTQRVRLNAARVKALFPVKEVPSPVLAGCAAQVSVDIPPRCEGLLLDGLGMGEFCRESRGIALELFSRGGECF